MNDTGINIPETESTLLEQQKALIEERQMCQMFPIGTFELPLPNKMSRTQTKRGVFHFNSKLCSEEFIINKSNEERENEILGLGDYNKSDVMNFNSMGENLFIIQETTPYNLEVKSSLACESTKENVLKEMIKRKHPDNFIKFITPTDLILNRVSFGDMNTFFMLIENLGLNI